MRIRLLIADQFGGGKLHIFLIKSCQLTQSSSFSPPNSSVCIYLVSVQLKWCIMKLYFLWKKFIISFSMCLLVLKSDKDSFGNLETRKAFFYHHILNVVTLQRHIVAFSVVCLQCSSHGCAYIWIQIGRQENQLPVVLLRLKYILHCIISLYFQLYTFFKYLSVLAILTTA